MSPCPFASFRTALLAGLGLVNGCAARSDEAPSVLRAGEAQDNSPDGGVATPKASLPQRVRQPGNVQASLIGNATAPKVDPVGARPALVEECSERSEPVGYGFEQCARGLVHRVSAEACPSELPRSDVRPLVFAPQHAPADGGAAPQLPYKHYDEQTDTFYDYECAQDSDCTEYPNGYCEVSSTHYAAKDERSVCTYGCVTDADCPTGDDGQHFVCECGSPVGRCVVSDCNTDADCGAGNACVRWQFDNGCGVQTGFACTSEQSECHTAADCTAEGEGCSGASGELRCVQADCAIGRPFLVHGAARCAGITARSDWQTTRSASRKQPLDTRAAQLRQWAANEWTRVGLLEHASVAAFARFALQLLSVGAPPQLLLETSQAMADETRHARLAFGLAARFGKSAVGPANLDVHDALTSNNLEVIVVNTLLEGCIGETVAALEARSALRQVRDREVADVLQEIARDEARHALLAWKFVQWACSAEPELVQRVYAIANHELQRAEQALSTFAGPQSSNPLAEFGIVSEGERTALRASALRDVVLPCLQDMEVARRLSIPPPSVAAAVEARV